MKSREQQINTSAVYSPEEFYTPTKSYSTDREKILSGSKKLAFSNKFLINS